MKGYKMDSDFNPDVDLINFEPAEFLAFRDMKVCEGVAKIKKEDITKHPEESHPYFKIRVDPVKN
jgi:hypothetical protein